jgi:uncharacterized membrane protein YhiD involved in acid resistance
VQLKLINLLWDMSFASCRERCFVLYRLSAAVGIACGGGLYFAASFSTALNLLLLRFGPRYFDAPSTDASNGVSRTGRTDEWANLVGKDVEVGHKTQSYGGADVFQKLKSDEEEQILPSMSTRMASIRNRPTLM